MNPLVFIVGPTGVGKTDLALKWAKKDSAGILNCDSIQAYKELNIGSAKPDLKSRSFLPHYLFDEVSAPQVWTAGDFRKKSLKILKRELPHRKIFAVGASGFYIQALEKGMYPVGPMPKIMAKKLEERQNQEGLDSLYRELKKKDPETARQISPKDRYRIFRSLSLMESERKTVSQIKKEFKEQSLPWPYFKLGLNIPKEVLLKRVQKRAQNMLEKGLIKEVEGLLERGLRDWRPLNSVGYRETVLYLEGKIKKEQLAGCIVSRVMFLAKKQITWFKRDKSIKWLDGEQSALELYKKVFN